MLFVGNDVIVISIERKPQWPGNEASDIEAIDWSNGEANQYW